MKIGIGNPGWGRQKTMVLIGHYVAIILSRASRNIETTSDVAVLALVMVTFGLHGITPLNSLLICVGLVYAYLMRRKRDQHFALEEAFVKAVKRKTSFLTNGAFDVVDDSAWFANPSLIQQILTLVNALNLLQTLLQGRFAGAQLLAAFTVLVTFCFNIANTQVDKRYVVRYFLRISVGIQAVHLIHRETAHAHIKRFLVVRILSNMVMFDSILDGAFQLLFLSLVVAYHNGDFSVLVISLTAFGSIIVPLSVFPVRGLIALPIMKRLEKQSRDFPFHFWGHMFITVIPLVLIVNSFGGVSMKDSMLETASVTLGLAFLGRAAYVAMRQVNISFLPAALFPDGRMSRNEGNETYPKSTTSSPKEVSSSASVDSKPASSISSVESTGSDFVFQVCWFLTMTAVSMVPGPISWRADPFMGGLVMSSIGLLLLVRHTNSLNSLVIAHGIIALAFTKEKPWMLVALAACRIPRVSSAETDPLNCIPHLLVASSSIFQLIYYGHRDVLFFLVVTYFSSVIGLLQRQWARYLSQRVIVNELDSDSFLQHAVKQKLGFIIMSLVNTISGPLRFHTSNTVSFGGYGSRGGSTMVRTSQTIWEGNEEDEDFFAGRSGSEFRTDEGEDVTDEAMDDDDDVLVCRDLAHLVKQVVFEARIRHQDCHFMNIVRSLRIGRVLIWKSESRSLDEMFNQFSSEMHLRIVPSCSQMYPEEDFNTTTSVHSVAGKPLNSPSGASSCSTISSRWTSLRSSALSDASSSTLSDLGTLQLRMQWELVELIVSRLSGISRIVNNSGSREILQYDVSSNPITPQQLEMLNLNGLVPFGPETRSMVNLVLILERPSTVFVNPVASSMVSNMEYLIDTLHLGSLALSKSNDGTTLLKIVLHSETLMEEDLEGSIRGCYPIPNPPANSSDTQATAAAAVPDRPSLPPTIEPIIVPTVHTQLTNSVGTGYATGVRSRRKPKIVNRRDSDLMALPSNLTFAILDDVALVRKVLLSLLVQYCEASPKSFHTGDKLEEVQRFPRQVLALNPDFVILDQNLTFSGEDEIYGIDLAKQLRVLGYNGCIVLYSADNAGLFQGESSIDGFLEKGVHRHGSLRPALAAAWGTHMKRLQLGEI